MRILDSEVMKKMCNLRKQITHIYIDWNGLLFNMKFVFILMLHSVLLTDLDNII